ncbi:cell envelope integrity protein TolA [Stenotrophomonas sp. W1S232]|uniref:Cell envelope integrity protein TolA n=1 Tax=Stenotrophomonas koreensis TaxID=266128 RepID=A0A7W3YW00_9GAMM|nr:cell envelope integrity protein TolA [Stenotrophomonas koreensis]MBB1117707.1 cell envelope integrity protein TolA [Stenotrophomonas koreensis]
MHADLPPLPSPPQPSLARDLALAIGVHLLLLLVFVLAWWWSPQRTVEPAAGDPLQASLEVSAAEASAARRALSASEKLEALPEPAPEPTPLPEPAPEDTVPPPQPEPEPRPMDAATPMQHNAQERVAQPDTVEQERVSALAIAEQKARQEQEAKRRQEQIDLTERKRVEEAEQRRRLAAQQAEEREKKLAEERRQAAEQAQREQRLAEIRRQRERAQREAQAAEARLRQLAEARAQTASSNAAATAPSTPRAGAGGSSEDLTAKYVAAVQQAVLNQWIRPDSIPVGQRCRLTIRQLPGGEVPEGGVTFTSGCPYDEAGRRSVEAAILRAQPLPYRGFESVFQRTLNFNFEARDR